MDIAQEQNSLESLRLLAAQKRMYSQAKLIHFARVVAVLLLELAAPFVALGRPEWKEKLELGGAFVTLISAFILTGIETSRVRQAATVQEELDTHLFRLPWNRTLVGAEVAPEFINRAVSGYRGGEDKIRDWYPDPSGAPYPKDVLLCQRTNLVWGVRLQSTYAYALLALTLGYLLIGLWVGRHENLPAYAVAILVPALPALLEAIDTYRRHTESVREKTELLAHVEDLLHDKSKATRPTQTVDACRRVQDAIYLLRSTKPLVPDWWYWLWRKRFDMDARAAVHELKKRL